PTACREDFGLLEDRLPSVAEDRDRIGQTARRDAGKDEVLISVPVDVGGLGAGGLSRYRLLPQTRQAPPPKAAEKRDPAGARRGGAATRPRGHDQIDAPVAVEV